MLPKINISLIISGLFVGALAITIPLKQVHGQPVQSANSQLLGIDRLGIIYDINPETGEASNPRHTQFGSLGSDIPIDIVSSKNGDLYTVIQGSGYSGGDKLYKLDPTTGVATYVGFLNSDIRRTIFEGDLAINPINGRLYGISSNGYLFAIDTTTGRRLDITQIQARLTQDFSAMAFDSTGQLYALDTLNGNLVTLDPNTGKVLASVNINLKLGPGAGMDFNPKTGQLLVADGEVLSSYYGAGTATKKLYSLDTKTGNLTLIGVLFNASDGLVGLTFR